jgi:hypothetical protein
MNLFTTILRITRNNKFKVKKFINFFDRVKQALDKRLKISERIIRSEDQL